MFGHLNFNYLRTKSVTKRIVISITPPAFLIQTYKATDQLDHVTPTCPSEIITQYSDPNTSQHSQTLQPLGLPAR
jgi:hypothetical protein